MKYKSVNSNEKTGKNVSEITSAFILMICMCMTICAILCSCSFQGSDTDSAKLRDMDFGIVPEENVPDELRAIIDKQKKKLFKTTFEDGKNLYIVIGYGKQPTGGYSIKVNELYETKNSLHIETEFVGPSKNESVTQAVSYPYIVVKTTFIDKPVVFS